MGRMFFSSINRARRGIRCRLQFHPSFSCGANDSVEFWRTHHTHTLGTSFIIFRFGGWFLNSGTGIRSGTVHGCSRLHSQSGTDLLGPLPHSLPLLIRPLRSGRGTRRSESFQMLIHSPSNILLSVIFAMALSVFHGRTCGRGGIQWVVRGGKRGGGRGRGLKRLMHGGRSGKGIAG